MVRLTVLPIAEIARASDAFHCARLHANLTAGACSSRQGSANADTTGKATSRLVERREVARITAPCRDCAVGRQVVAQLKPAREVA
jgi:hypothetical protein